MTRYLHAIEQPTELHHLTSISEAEILGYADEQP